MEKSYWSVIEKLAFEAKVDDGRTTDDGQTDDGQVGIGKAPLPDGTAELKMGSTLALQKGFW